MADGKKEVLGLWIEQNVGARFWLRVMKELRHRGVKDILRALVDVLKGFLDAIHAVFSLATVQTCIVHLLRHSLDFVAYKNRKSVAAALEDNYRTIDADAGKTAFEAFADSSWGQKYAAIVQSWERVWEEMIPFYAFPAEVCKFVYTTNAREALKLLFLALKRAEKEWIMPPREWSMAKAQFAILFGERFARAAN